MLLSFALDYRTAEPAELGAVDCDDAQLQHFSDALRRDFGVEELFFLKTCNRREFYLTLPETVDVRALRTQFQRNFERDGLVPGFQVRFDQHCVRHFFTVAASLASMALGEYEITHQIKTQSRHAALMGLSGRRLSHLVEAALHAGKRVRGETQIGRQVVSPLSLVYQKINGWLQLHGGSRVVFVGAGDYIHRLLRLFSGHDTRRFLFVNRSENDLADHYGGSAMLLADFHAAPPAFDVLVTATGAPRVLFDEDWLRRAVADRPVMIFDGATPPDCEPACLPETTRFWRLSDLEPELRRNRRERAAEIPEAEHIIEKETARFWDKWRGLAISDDLQALQDYYQQEALAPLETFAAKHQLSETQRRELQQMVAFIGRRLAVVPVLALRAVTREFGAQGMRLIKAAIAKGSPLFRSSR